MSKSTLIVLFSLMVLNIFSQKNYKFFLNEANTDFENKDYKGAIEKFSKALEYKSEITNAYRISEIYYNRALARYYLKNYDYSIKDLDEAINVKAEFIKAYVQKGTIYLKLKKPELCISVCNQGLNYSYDENLIINKAYAYQQQKKYDSAIYILKNLLNHQPNSIAAIRLIGSNFNYKKMWDSASYFFSMALELNPKDAFSLFDRGISKSYLKDYQGAKIDIEKGMEIDTMAKSTGYNNLGFFLKLEQKDYEGAVTFFDKAIDANPNFAYAYSNRGFAKLNLGDIKGAYKDIEKSIYIDNSNSYAHKNLALVHLKNNKKKDACQSLKKAKELGYSDLYDGEVDKLLEENCK